MTKVLVELCANNLANNEDMEEIVRQLDQESAGMAQFATLPCLSNCESCVKGVPIARIDGAMVECATSEQMAIKIRQHVIAAQENPRLLGKGKG